MQTVTDLGRRYPYILKDQFHSWLGRLLAQQMADGSPAIALVNCVLALGYRLVHRRRSKDFSDFDSEAQYHASIQAARADVMGAPPSILTIQVSLKQLKRTDINAHVELLGAYCHGSAPLPPGRIFH